MSTHHSSQENAVLPDVVTIIDTSTVTKGGIDHIDAEKVPEVDPLAGANRTEEAEHSVSLWDSVKDRRAALGWSFVISLCIIQEGYDTGLLSSFFGLPAFQKRYGDYNFQTKKWALSAAWQAGLQQSVTVGSFFGIVWGSFLVDKLGYRKALMVNLVLIIPFIGLTTFAPNKVGLLFGELLCGLPWGAFSTLVEAYASEICPLSLRGYMTTYVNLCWVMGHFLSSGVLVGTQTITSQWGYRLPFAIQWIWPPFLLVGIYLAPEAPYWLVRKGRLVEAEHAVRRLSGQNSQDDAPAMVANMVRVNELEVRAMAANTTRYWDCFKKTDLRRTEISAMAWACQRLCGTPLSNYAVVFLQSAGLPTTISFAFGLANSGASFVGTCLSWVLITHFGRRTIFLCGLSSMLAILLLIGILAVISDHGHHAAMWGQAVLLLIFLFTYDLTIGPLAYCVVGESSSTRLRHKTVGISRNAYNVVTIVSGIATPYMLNAKNLNWGGKTGFFWSGFCGLALVWAFFRLPEMKGRSYLDLDILFANRVKAREFSKATIVSETEVEIAGREHRLTNVDA